MLCLLDIHGVTSACLNRRGKRLVGSLLDSLVDSSQLVSRKVVSSTRGQTGLRVYVSAREANQSRRGVERNFRRNIPRYVPIGIRDCCPSTKPRLTASVMRADRCNMLRTLTTASDQLHCHFASLCDRDRCSKHALLASRKWKLKLATGCVPSNVFDVDARTLC